MMLTQIRIVVSMNLLTEIRILFSIFLHQRFTRRQHHLEAECAGVVWSRITDKFAFLPGVMYLRPICPGEQSEAVLSELFLPR